MERIPNVDRGRVVRIQVDGEFIDAHEGETVAAALLVQSKNAWRESSRFTQPRGMFCGMGVCFDCLLTINGRPNQQACTTLVHDGMKVESQLGHGQWDKTIER